MNLLNDQPRLGRRATITATAACLLMFGSCRVVASAFNFQPDPLVASDLKPYAGTWHWMFQGKPFVTMVLIPADDHFAGSITNGTFTSDKDGNMTAAAEKLGTSPIVRSFFAGKVLHLIVEDSEDKGTNDFTMSLTAPGKAEVNSGESDAPKNLKPWAAERATEDTYPPTSKSDVAQIGAGVTPPKITYSVEPTYPPDNKNRPVSGYCIIGFLLDATGMPQQVHATRSLGPDFDQRAIDAVKEYRFQPAMFKGKPVAVQMSIEVNFKRY